MYTFASHFAPDSLEPALQFYRTQFKPSQQLGAPHAMVGVNIIAADTYVAPRCLATTQQILFTDMFRGTRGLSEPPINDIDTYWSPSEKASHMLAYSIVSSMETVRAGMERLISLAGADDINLGLGFFLLHYKAAIIRNHCRYRQRRESQSSKVRRLG